MQKQALISEVSAKLNGMGLNHIYGSGSDISIICEFLDAGWSTGKKKIIYEASAFFDETGKTIFLWEFTKEVNSGFSFGMDSGSSFQTGKTLFRKVMSIRYGPDGKAYEYSIDLGAIPKAFKETAKAYGWKFKTVLKREKASYPPGYLPVGVNHQLSHELNQALTEQDNRQQASVQPQPLNAQFQQAFSQLQQASIQSQQADYQPQQQFSNPNGAFYAQGKSTAAKGNTGALFIALFIFFAVITSMLYILTGTSVAGWILSMGVFSAVIFLQRKLVGKGCIAGTAMWIITLVILFFIFALTTDTSNTVSNGALKDETGKAGSTGVSVSDKKQPRSSSYYLNSFWYTALPGGVEENRQELQYNPYVLINFCVGVSTDFKDKGDKPANIYLTNFKVIAPPKLGKVVFLKNVQGPIKDEIARNSIRDRYELDISDIKNMDGFAQSFLFYGAIYDTKSFKYDKNVKSIASDRIIADAGLSYKDVQAKISFDIEVETVSGGRYVKNMECLIMPDDFINKPEAISVSEEYNGIEAMKPFVKK